jgi:Gram-negative bacterial TonB protein C-terminal
MPTHRLVKIAILLLTSLNLSMSLRADDPEKLVKKAVERCTLNQPGTKPFHLKAVLAPSLERDRGSNRTGEVEIWWASPTQWKRELRSPEFHQVAIRNGAQEWQKNEGDYLPEWLREISVALIEPVPQLDKVLVNVRDADVKRMMGSTYFSWITMSSNGTVEKGVGAGIAITDKTGLLFYGGDLGWGGMFKDYENFHGRQVARTVSWGSPEVTAKVTLLEDMRDIPPGLYDTAADSGDTPLLRTILLDEPTLRKYLLPTDPLVWPSLQDGPLEGAVTTEIVVDRAGKVRQLGTIVSDNPGLSEIAGKAIAAMRFKPYLQDGAPVQVVSRATLSFKIVRPEGAEAFESARTYFEHGRHVSFAAAGNGPAYVLRATFQVRVAAGSIQDGQYVDTWKSDSEWRREATIGNSHFVRARHGDTRYLLSEGPDAKLLQLVLRIMEPIPAIDTFVESDWRIKRDSVDGVKTIRVLAGYESPEGNLDPQQARGYWFDENGKLVKTFFQGIETQRSNFEEFNGAQVAQVLKVMRAGSVGMVIRVTDVAPAGAVSEDTFKLRGHEWKRAFTDEVR